jgi:hypothetical protein
VLIDNGATDSCTWRMASTETEARLRIADGLVVIALAITSIFMIWRRETEAWFGIMQSLMVAVLVFLIRKWL